MEYVKTERTASDYTVIINDLVKKVRENPTWKREYMDAMMNSVHQKNELEKAEARGMAAGIETGARDARIETARNYLLLGLAPEQVAQGSALTLEEVQKIASSLKV